MARLQETEFLKLSIDRLRRDGRTFALLGLIAGGCSTLASPASQSGLPVHVLLNTIKCDLGNYIRSQRGRDHSLTGWIAKGTLDIKLMVSRGGEGSVGAIVPFAGGTPGKLNFGLSGSITETNTTTSTIDFIVGTDPREQIACSDKDELVSKTLGLADWLNELKKIRKAGAPLSLTSLDFGLVFGVKTNVTLSGGAEITPVTVSAKTQRDRDDLHTLTILLDPPPPPKEKVAAKIEQREAKSSVVIAPSESGAPAAQLLPPDAARLQTLQKRMFAP